MAKTVTKTIKVGRIRVPKRFGKGYKSKRVRLGKEKSIVKTRGRMNEEQIISSLKSDKAKIEGLKAVTKGRNIRTALLTTGAEASQALSKVQTAPTYKTLSHTGGGLKDLIGGGIQVTGNQRDEDNDEVI